MGDHTTFRFAARGISFEVAGSEDFVRRHLQDLLPFVRAAVEAAQGAGSGETVADAAEPVAPTAGAPATAPGDEGLAAWYAQNVPPGAQLTMQDSILVFAYWMRTFRKFIFTSEDIRRAFADVGQEEPKSLLQILGTLKRDHNLILGTERRGEYMLNTTGIARARELLGLGDTAVRR